MTSKLGESLLAGASANAQRRGHREVQVEHLLASLVGDSVLARELSVRGLSVALLAERLEAALGGVPETRGYREGTHDVVISPVVQALLARLSGWRMLLYDASFRSLIEIALLHPPIARVLPSCRFDATAIRDLHVASSRMMESLGHGTLFIEHALMALTEDARFGGALSLLNHEPASVLAQLQELVGPEYRSRKLAPSEQLIQFAIIRGNLARRRALTTEFLVVDLLRAEYAEAPLSALGIDRFDLLFAFVHGMLAGALPTAGRVVIVLHDDDFTTMDIVVHVLVETMGLDRDDAARRMLDVHRSGKAEIARMDATEAADKIAAARSLCRDEWMPLRIEAIPMSDPV